MGDVSPHSNRVEPDQSDGQILTVSTWNVEGLTDLKTEEICKYMKNNSIDIQCIQETRKPNSDYYITDNGYLVITSGGSNLVKEWAGVGFIVAPWIRPHIQGFCQLSNRVASIKIKTVCSGIRGRAHGRKI